MKMNFSNVRLRFSEEEFKNPSPSGDKWFENPKNLEMIRIGEQQLREGKGKILTTELKKELFG